MIGFVLVLVVTYCIVELSILLIRELCLISRLLVVIDVEDLHLNVLMIICLYLAIDFLYILGFVYFLYIYLIFHLDDLELFMVRLIVLVCVRSVFTYLRIYNNQ